MDIAVSVPLYYFVGRAADVDAVHLLLRITPVEAAVVTNNQDISLGHQYANMVLMNEDPVEVAEYTRRPCVVICDGDAITAVYEGDRRERLG